DDYRRDFAPDPDKKTPVANIGIPFALDGWQERATGAMFLTAVAPGNPLFSGYFPHSYSVFSFYDDLAGIETDTLSYYFVGWYSDPSGDMAATWKKSTSPTAFDDLLARLRWSKPAAQPTASLYQGACFNLVWNRKGPPPTPDPLQTIRDTRALNV